MFCQKEAWTTFLTKKQQKKYAQKLGGSLNKLGNNQSEKSNGTYIKDELLVMTRVPLKFVHIKTKNFHICKIEPGQINVTEIFKLVSLPNITYMCGFICVIAL